MVCYRHVGCFRDEGPFDYLDTLPAPPETINTTFTLYTRKNPVNGMIIILNNLTSLDDSNFDDKQLVKIVIHGFGSTGKNPWVLQMAEALLFAVSYHLPTSFIIPDLLFHLRCWREKMHQSVIILHLHKRSHFVI